MKRIVIVFGCALCAHTWAGVYKCKVDGQVVYQASPCASGGHELKIDLRPARAADQPKQAGASASGAKAVGARYTRQSELVFLVQSEIQNKRRAIRRHQKKIKVYQKRMRRELAALREKKRYANNNLAGAMWEQSISMEMQSVTQKYRQLIEVEEFEIKTLREQIAALQASLKEP